MKTGFLLQTKVDKEKLIEKRAKEYYHILLKLGVYTQGHMENIQAVETAIKTHFANIGPKHLRTICTAYNYYREVNNIEEKLDFKIDRRRKLPVLTPEPTLKAAIPLPPELKWQAYFRLLYETGPRPQEPSAMRKQDINFDRNLVRLGTEKGSGETLERELPISPLLTEQLRTLCIDKDAEHYVFVKPTVRPFKPLDYDDIYRTFSKVRKQLRQAGYNTRGFIPYVYRHAFATRLYYATKELPLVQRSLGHRNIEDSMIYIHLQPDQIKRFDVMRLELADKNGITLKIAEGWELAVQTPEEIYFKRPRWVP